MRWPFKYRSGEEIQVGDRMFFDGHPALVTHVISPEDSDRNNWHLPDGGVVFLTKHDRFALELDEHELDDISFKMRAADDPEKEWQRDWPGPQGRYETQSWKKL